MNLSQVETDQLIDRLRSAFDLRGGELFWRSCHSNFIKPGSRAGCMNGNGYRRINVAGRKLYEHQCVFAMTHGRLPVGVIDHINGDKTDNRPENLREGTQAQNLQNQRAPARTNKVGLLGVSQKRKKYLAQIKTNRRAVRIGLFDTPEEAHAAYVEVKRRVHPFSTL